MFGVSLNLESTPLNSNGYNGSDTLRGKGSDDYIGAVGGIFGFNFDIQVGLSMNINFGDKLSRWLLFLFLSKPTFYKTHLILSNNQEIKLLTVMLKQKRSEVHFSD